MRFVNNKWITVGLALILAVWWSYAQGTIQVGYTVVTRTVGTAMPVGTAVFSYRNGDGVLVTEAGVGATELVERGRVFADEVGTRTGLALVNTGAATVPVTLTLRDGAGTQVGQQTVMLNSGQHSASFVDELFGSQAADFRGNVTFESASGLGAITLRESRNARGEPLYTTLPVVDLDRTVGTDPVVFPHLAVGGGYRTQVILINRSAEAVTGRVQLVGSDGLPLQVDWDGVAASEGNYEIAADGVYRVELTGASDVQVGYAVVTPETGSTPSGSVIFQLWTGTTLITEAGVGATPETTTARISLDNVGRQTGVAIANRGSTAAEVQFILQDRFATEQKRVTQTIPAGGHLARMAGELFPAVSSGFIGLVEVQSSVAVAAVTLQLTINTLGEVVLTTLSVADLTRPLSADTVVFPQVVIGSGFATRLVFVNGPTASNVEMTFSNSDGTPMNVPIAGVTSNQFASAFASGEGLRLFPGDTATLSSLSLRDSGTNQPTTEVTINEGNTLRARILALDSAGKARDDFAISYVSLDTATATVDSTGRIEGKQRGFSTLTITAGGLVSAATITVVGIASAGGGGFATGIAQDLAGRVYLASAETHTLLRAQGLANAPEVYAGVSQQPGLKNDVRLQSQFESPSFLSVDQARGNVYVSDSANHVIREVKPGPGGRVETLAGSGSAGSVDGTSTAAAFNSPQGIVLDNRGHLWVADQSNHSIRRINLLTGVVETIAGQAGQAGFADGQGSSALFNSPTGIALESETTAQQLARELSGAAPPPVQVIVADTGNGAVRRVTEAGTVETLGSPISSSLSVGPSASPIELSDALSLTSPTGVAVDPFGNIFVTEAGSAEVRAILTSGEVVAAAQSGTFETPRGISITRSGRLLVAEADRAPKEIRFAEPQITTVSPQQINAQGGATVTIKGRNFAPDSSVFAAGVTIAAQFVDSQTLSFVSPALPSGRVTVTVQGRGGLAQSSLLAEPVSLDQLPAGHITTIAGGSSFAGDGSAAVAALLWRSYGLAFDSAGNLYVADPDDHRIRKIDRQTGIILTVAGTGLEGFSGDGGPAVAAELNRPWGVALDGRGNLLIADSSNNRIRAVDLTTGLISTVAGTGGFGTSGDGGPAVNALMRWPLGLVVDDEGDWFIADAGNHNVRKVDGETGIITTVAGSSSGAGFSGDGGPATSASLNGPRAVGLDRDGNLLISDTDNLRVRKVDASGVISTVLGNGERVTTFSVTNGVATEFGISEPLGLALSAEGDVFVAAAGIVRFGDGLVTTVLSGQSGVPTFAKGLAVDSSGDLFASDAPAEGTGEFSSRVLRIDSSTDVTEYAGGSLPLGDGEQAWAARLFSPGGITIAPDGSLLIADRSVSRIRKVDAGTGLISTVAGFGALNLASSGFNDNVPATEFGLVFPEGVVTDSDGNIYIADTVAGQIQKVDVNSGILTTILDVEGDDSGSSQPVSVDLDADGNLYFADAITDKVTKVDTVGSTSVTLDLSDSLTGEGPLGIVIDRPRNQLYVADSGNSTIIRIDLSTLEATRVAGTEGPFGGFNGEGVRAIDALLGKPLDVTVDSNGNLFIADSSNNLIRRVDAESGIIQTIAGDLRPTFSGDNGVGTDASIHSPNGVAVDSSGNVYISDTKNNRIRVIRGPIP